MRLLDIGAIVEFGHHDGMVHVSEISDKRIGKPEDILKIGQEVKVLMIESRDGKNKLSIKRVKD